MTGSKYSYAVTQLETHGVLHLDSHMFIQEDFYQSDPNIVAHIMTQLSLKSSLKQWGDKGYAVVTSEMKQLHFCNTFRPKHWSKLLKTQHRAVLELHMFLKEKRDGSLKGRTVAGGNSKTTVPISKEDASSPTITTEAVLLSCIINAKEGRDVTVINIPNAFIQMRVEDEGDIAIIKICGVIVDILVQIAPDVYKSYVMTDKKGTKQLLVQCQNALYDYKTFWVLVEEETLPNEYKCLPYHIMFDVKFNLCQKALLVAGGNVTDPPKEDIYLGVASMDTIQLGFMLAKMNDLKI